MVVLAALLWNSGAFDKQLASAGLARHTCATNFFGGTICGDELVQFCKTNYDKTINGDTCDSVLEDAGIDPGSIAAAQQRQQQQTSAASAQDDNKLSDGFVLDDVHGLIVAVERCFRSTADYTRCDREDNLGFVSAIIGDRTGEIEVRASSPTAYAVIAHSETGTDFSYIHDESGEEWSCTAPGKGRCKQDGTWSSS